MSSRRFDIERAVLTSDLSSVCRLLLLVLLVRADARTAVVPEKHTPSITDLENNTGLARSSVARILNELESSGWLVRQRPAPEDARRGVKTRYAIKTPSPMVALQVVPDADHPSPTGGSEVVPQDYIPSPTIGRKREQPQSVTTRASARGTEPWDSRAVQSAIIEELERHSGKVVDRLHARLEAKRLLDGKSYADAIRYCRGAIQNAAFQGRLKDHLPTPQPPQWREQEETA